MPLLRRIVAKLRGLLGLGAMGGIAGVMGGTLWAGALEPLGRAFPTIWDVVGLAAGAGLSGAACGMGFGALLMALESKRRLEDLPLYGAILGGLLSSTMVGLAKRAQDAELAPAEELAGLLEAE